MRRTAGYVAAARLPPSSTCRAPLMTTSHAARAAQRACSSSSSSQTASSTGPGPSAHAAASLGSSFSLLDVMGDDRIDFPLPSNAGTPGSTAAAAAQFHPQQPTYGRTRRPSSSRAQHRAPDGDDGGAAAAAGPAPPQPQQRPRGSAEDGDGAPHQWPAFTGTPQDIQQAVRAAVLGPLGDRGGEEGRAAPPKAMAMSSSSVSMAPLVVRVADKFGMPADLPRGAPQTFQDLLGMSPEPLRGQLQAWLQRNPSVVELTAVQQAAIPLVMEYRDVLCIAPTATGKTFSYAFPTMLRLAMDDSKSSGSAVGGEDEAEEDGSGTGAPAKFSRRDVEALLREKINSGEVCRYCEMNIADNPICSMTGVPHPPAPSMLDAALNTKTRRAVRLEELAVTAEPRVLVLVPTSQLAFQVYNIFRGFHSDFNIRYMVRASSAEEQKKFLRALEGTEVLISTPETILPALYKRKLSLRRVSTLILDEIDDLVSVNHFEKIKIILGALPKDAAERPQRLLFGASLPPVAYNMIKEKMLLPAHRFILADAKTDHLGHPIAATTTTHRQGRSRSSSSSTTAGDSVANTNIGADGGVEGGGLLAGSGSTHTHLVFMLGRIEKINKVAWLYQTGRLTADQRTIIFCNSRHNVAYVRDHLARLVPEVKTATLTSRASVTAREGVLKMFSSGVATCLIATDLLSRGIDFKGVMYVVHFDMPSDMETWVHRNGRCGRGGLPGYVYTFFQPENVRMAKPLTAFLRQHRQLVPPKLQEYAKQPFLEVFRKGQFHHPTRPYRRDDPQNTTPVLGRGTPRFPDYRQEGLQKNFRPL